MIAQFARFNLRLLLILATSFGGFSALLAQDDTQTNVSTETVSTNKKAKDTQKDAKKAALEAQKNANDLRKITLLLAIAQDRDRQAAESMEDIRSRRLRIEEDLLDADDNPKNFTKKQRSDLELQLKSLQKKEKLAQTARENANTLLLEVTQAVAAEPSKRSKFIGGYEKKFGPVNDSKSVEMPLETLATTEKEPSKSVAISEKTKNQTPTTPSVNTPVFSENMPEPEPKITVPTSKKKKETRVKQNESPKKVTEKTSKKKTETPKKADDFPVVFNENPTPKTDEETLAEPKKTEKKAAKKESKKKVKKAEKPTETETKADDFPIVLADTPLPQTVPQTVPQTMPSSEPIVEKSTETPVETPNQNESTNEEKDVKKGKKAPRKDKKTKKSDDEEVSQGSLVSYRTYERNIDVYMNSPAPDCAIAYEGKDEFTGKMKRETMPTRFFTHTDDIMRKALMDKDFITCDITGTKVESSRYTYLNLTFTILSKDIQRSLGFLDRGTPIIFVLVNGNKVTLLANKTDIGVVDIDKGTTTYRAQMTAESIPDLTNSEIDYVRVNWTSGYEDYEVFDVDVLKNLFNCLYKK
jgi:hypothetical protein